jgi:corrinoid protein of di/trimethylamine methyltransferase
MATAQDVYQRMRDSILTYDRQAARAAAHEAVNAGLDPVEAVERGFAAPIRRLGAAFDRMEIFLPQLVMAADAVKAGMAVLMEAAGRRGAALEKKAVVVLGTVEGDTHDIGKAVVAALLHANGYEVHDLGVDVPVGRFVSAAEELKADVIGMSALVSTTMAAQRDVIELLREQGLKDRYFTIVGGAPVTKRWAEEIGADAYGRDAVDAVRVLDDRSQGSTR